MHKWRVGLILSLFLLSLSLAACWPAQGGRATPEGGGKGEELESPAGGFVWRRVGGIAGFCDVVSVESDDAAFLQNCRVDPPETLNEVELTAAQTALLDELVARLGSFNHEQSDPAMADALTITIDFAGVGDERPSDDDIAAIGALANEILVAARTPADN